MQSTYLPKGTSLVDIEEYHDVIVNSHCVFTILSRIDNLKVFSEARDGLKITKSLLERLGISKAKYHKAIQQLKDAGLIENAKNGQEDELIYTHTRYGSMVYQKNVLEIGKYTKNLDKMQMIDTIKHAQKFSAGVIAMFNEQIMNNIVDSGGSGHFVVSASTSSSVASDSSFSISSHENIDDNSSTYVANTNAIPKARIILSYDNIIQLLRERIELCKSEILIATRTSPEIIINRILQKSKMGVKVKVVADTELVRQYFEYQREFTSVNDDNTDDKNDINPTNSHDSKRRVKDNASKKNNTDDDYGYWHQRDCRNIVANPYYPKTNIHRRISDLPFGMIILDGSEVGVELVNSNNSKEFFAGVWIKEEEFAMAMKRFYQTIWNKASSP